MKMLPAYRALVLGAAASLIVAADSQAQGLSFRDSFTATPGGGEILAFDPGLATVFGTYSQSTGDDKTLAISSFGLDFATLQADGTFGSSGAIDFASWFSSNLPGYQVNSLSSVAIDPLGRGFGVASIIPAINAAGTDFASTWTPGKIVLFNTSSKSVITSFDVGYHPDMVTFTPDGSKILVANEGEYNADNAFQANGSLSVVNVVESGLDFTGTTVSSYDFDLANLGSGVDLVGVRDNTLGMNRADTVAGVANLEPEYIKVNGTEAFVTLQENNAVGTFDLATNKWTSIARLGTIEQVIDASDRDTPGNNDPLIKIDQSVKGMPMPDAIDSFSVGGNKYYVTANEGDFRLDDFERIRVKDMGETNAVLGNLDPTYASTINQTDEGIGRLRVSNIDGDLDGDNDIDEVRMPGTRSFSVWDSNGNLVFDSNDLDFGSGATGFESWIAMNDPINFNIDGTAFDGRSDDKGPEPEGIVLGKIDGDLYAFVGLERTNHIFMFKLLSDVDTALTFNPAGVEFVSAINTPGAVSPEGLTFIPAASSPTGGAMLLVGNEVSGTWTAYAVPEPSTWVLIGLGAAFLLWRVRRPA
ncbi:MAG: choice-of-anchor I family protein [Terrimicrobiaceae bacterium]